MRRAAFTLVEMLITVGLAGLASTLIFLIFHSVFRSVGLSVERSTATQESVLWFRRWIHEMEGSTAYGLSYGLDLGPDKQRVLAIQPVKTVSSQARPVYSTRDLIVYRFNPAQRRLRRQTFDHGVSGISLNADNPRRLTGEQLLRLEASSDCRVFSLEGVRDWSLGSVYSGALLSRDLHPSLTMVFHGPQGKEVELHQQRDFLLPICP